MTIPSYTANLDLLPERSETVVSSPLLTGMSFFAIAERFSRQPGTVVLASGGNADCARYNILGIDPWLSVRSNLTHTTIATPDQSVTVTGDPLEILHNIIRHYHLSANDYPSPLCTGLLGYLSYDLKDCIEHLPRTSVDDLHLPHLYMVAPSVIIVEDLFEQKKYIHVSSSAGDPVQRKSLFEKALDAPVPEKISPLATARNAMASCFTRKEYMQAIDAIREYIVRGHVYQVNMSQRFETTFHGDAFALFTSLFARNPAPFFAYINAGDHYIVSTSPERFIEVRGKLVETRPIKGTRPRGKNQEEDLRQREQLIGSRKDDAELSMIVDLLRNDIGKVCSAGSVKVRRHKCLEAYENVFHLVSIVEGTLDDDKDAVDCIRATFPGGSITGCPKIRSMEIIDELEPVRRHIYTGSIGYISFHDTMDLSIAIRTATIKDDRLVFSVGGGVVYDSDPSDEYEETLHKGKTLMSAFGEAPTGSIGSKRNIAWYNGKFMPLNDIAIPVKNEGFLYGFGIFETIRVSRGIVCRLPEHIERFNRSWQSCFGSAPPDITWNTVITEVVDRCGLSNEIAAVKVLAAAGEPGKPETVTLLVMARRYIHRLDIVGRSGLHCAVYPYRRQSHLSSLKTMNYMFCKMANDWAHHQGADEAIILNADGSICETATANILCIINGLWYRPAGGYALSGTMEKAVCTYLAHQGIIVGTRPISIDDVKKADRVYLTNALMGIVPVHRIDETPLNDGFDNRCKEITMALLP